MIVGRVVQFADLLLFKYVLSYSIFPFSAHEWPQYSSFKPKGKLFLALIIIPFFIIISIHTLAIQIFDTTFGQSIISSFPYQLMNNHHRNNSNHDQNCDRNTDKECRCLIPYKFIMLIFSLIDVDTVEELKKCT